MLPRKSYNLFEVTISQGDERDDVTHLTNPWLPSTDLIVLIQGLFFKSICLFPILFLLFQNLKNRTASVAILI